MTDRAAFEDGFTLIELLAVIFIIGLMTSLVAVQLRDDPPPAEAHAEDLADSFRRLSREAILSGQPVSWGMQGDRHVFERYVDGDWRRLDLGRSPLPEALPDGVSLQIEGETARPERTLRDAEPEPRRLVVFLPVGETTDMRFSLSGPETSLDVTVDASGRVSLREGGL